MKRADAFALVIRHGGKPRQGVTKDTRVLIVGELGWPLQDDGQPSNSLATAKSYGVPIVSERRFLEWVGKSSPEKQAKTFTEAQLAALSKLPADVIEQLSIFGLIEAVDGHYGFCDLAAARQVAQLLGAGIVLSLITRSLADIRKWLPDARLSNLRLFPESSDKILVKQLLGRTDSKGQFVLPVAKPNDADADEVFAYALRAEEAGDLSVAESLYQRVMKLDPNDPAAGFNLGNLLRGQQRIVEAEAAYRWAVKVDPRYAPACTIWQICLMRVVSFPKRLSARSARSMPIHITPMPYSTWRRSYSGLISTQKRRRGGRGISSTTARRCGRTTRNAH